MIVLSCISGAFGRHQCDLSAWHGSDPCKSSDDLLFTCLKLHQSDEEVLFELFYREDVIRTVWGTLVG